MCCGQAGHHEKKHGHHGGCHCDCGMHAGPAFLSKKRKVKMVEHRIECMREEVKDMEELLDELKKEK